MIRRNTGEGQDAPAGPEVSFAPPKRGKKSFTLRLIQTAWVAEAAAALLYTMIAVPVMEPDRVNLWLAALPLLTAIIGGQGAAAGAGPLAADWLKKEVRNED